MLELSAQLGTQNSHEVPEEGDGEELVAFSLAGAADLSLIPRGGPFGHSRKEFGALWTQTAPGPEGEGGERTTSRYSGKARRTWRV